MYLFLDQVLSQEDNKKLSTFERMGMENYLLRENLSSREKIDARVATTGER